MPTVNLPQGTVSYAVAGPPDSAAARRWCSSTGCW